MSGSEESKLELVTSEEYHEIRESIEQAMTEYTENILFKGICQDEVASLIQSMDGIVSYYKKETEKEVVYDYCIGLRINREEYEG